ncbi:MAG: aspartate aminotransferase family protein [Desulfobacteraceae bacterium]|nr:MAG: aspartate aminotransferase family protein [Desulfobacteraceae bacterium]
MEEILHDAVNRSLRYVANLKKRRVGPSVEAMERLEHFRKQLQDAPADPLAVLAELDEYGSDATVASTGGRYFGFVTGGVLPAALGANILAGVWDQNAVLEISSPVSSVLEEVCRKWLISIFSLPSDSAVGFVTGATMANFTGLAAARHAVLADSGWDVEAQGLFGAPPVTVIVGNEVHVSLLKALSMLGLGRDRVVRIPVDSQGRMIAGKLPGIGGPTIVCIQAGNVNTGAFDPAGEICALAKDAGAWVHVDGAFGMWAAASPKFSSLAEGISNADSWATDAHKWLNVPYDSGLVFVREPRNLRAAMSTTAAYLIEGSRRDPCQYVPELSRRARGIEIWAALCSLGRCGLSSLIERTCGYAARTAKELRHAGFNVLNDVVLNQVLVSFGNPEVTRRVVSCIQKEGTCWCGGTEWQGKAAMRISISSWATDEDDIEKCIETMIRIASEEADSG